MIKVFVVILNWNRVKDTIQCLKSVGALRTKNYELIVVVVDNGSTDGSVERLKELQTSKLAKFQLINNKRNLGFAGGNNVGIRYSLKNGADYVMILNNDTIVDKSLLMQLVRVAEKYKDAGALSPKIYFAKGFEFHKKRYKKSDLGKVIWYAGGNMDWNNIYGTNHGVDQVDSGQFNKICETDFATGAAMLLRAKALRKVGIFDENYFMYLEDADLSVRMKQKDWKVLYAPPACLWHKVAQSSAIGDDLNDYYITRNRMFFGMQYAPVRTKLALIKESWKLLTKGRKWQKVGIKDFYLRVYGKGSWKN